MINKAKKIMKKVHGAVVKGSVDSPMHYPPKSPEASKGNSIV